MGSAAGMDKDVMKSLFRAAGLPIVKHVTVLRSEWEGHPKKLRKLVESKLSYPVFVKPANLGSSVGISKAHDGKELGPAMEAAAKFDRKIVIEQGVGGKKGKARRDRMLGAGERRAEASVAGEIVPCTRVLRLRRQVSGGGIGVGYSGEADEGGDEGVQQLACGVSRRWIARDWRGWIF